MKSIKFAAVAAFAVAALPAQATINTVFNSFSAGASSFDTKVTNAGGTVDTQSLISGQSVYGDFTVSKTPGGAYALYNSPFPYTYTSGGVVGIDPQGTVKGPNGDSRPSGVTFDFGANKINSIGFEVGDWGTCCQVSSLYIAFDGGAAIQVGSYTGANNVFLTNGGAGVFVAAFDDSNDFSSVTFWGDGFGEYLVAGGTVRYALLDQGSLPAVPEPATWAMMLTGFGVVGGALRRRSKLALA